MYKKHLQHAIDLAIHNKQKGGDPFGAVVVLNDEIVGEGVNMTHLHNDVSGHAELLAIKNAQQKLERFNLSDCVLVASGYPCPMCFGAAVFAGIKTIVYANTLEEAQAIGLDLSSHAYDYIKGQENPLDLQMIHIQMDDNPMKKC